MKLPIVDFLGVPTSKLIVGCNPFVGFSYHSPEMDEEMMDYYVGSRISQTLMQAQAIGYTTMLLLADSLLLRVVREYRENGGTMDMLAQVTEAPLPPLLKASPRMAYMQGGLTDNYIERGDKQLVIDKIKQLKDHGIKAGFASHKPEYIEMAEEEGWGAQFYMVSLHRKPEGHVSSAISGITDAAVENPFVEGTRPIALETIRKIQKPCIAYKIFRGGYLARGDEQTRRAAMEEALTGIKENDIAVVGIYQRYTDQLGENSDMASDILSK